MAKKTDWTKVNAIIGQPEKPVDVDALIEQIKRKTQDAIEKNRNRACKHGYYLAGGRCRPEICS